jgi:hypothetical protein
LRRRRMRSVLRQRKPKNLEEEENVGLHPNPQGSIKKVLWKILFSK